MTRLIFGGVEGFTKMPMFNSTEVNLLLFHHFAFGYVLAEMLRSAAPRLKPFSRGYSDNLHKRVSAHFCALNL